MRPMLGALFLSGTFCFTNILFLQVRGSGGLGLATFCGSRAHEGIRSTRVESVVLAGPESKSEAGCPSSRRVGQRFHREWMAASEWRKNYYTLDPLALCSSGPFGLRVDHEFVGDDNKKQQGLAFMVFYDFYVNSYICWLQMYGDGICVSTDPCKAHEHVTPI